MIISNPQCEIENKQFQIDKVVLW